jgi:hypothetical protein
MPWVICTSEAICLNALRPALRRWTNRQRESRTLFRRRKKESMLNIARHAAIAAAGIGFAAMAAPPAADACFVPAAYGCGGAVFGMYRPVIHRSVYGYAYRPAYGYAYAAPRIRVYRPVALRVFRPVALRVFRPVTYGWAAPHYSTYGYAYAAPHYRAYRPVALRAVRPVTYGWAAPRYSTYGYAAPRHRIYRAVAFHIVRPVRFAWAVPHYRYRSYGAAYGAYMPVRRAYAFVPRYRPVFAFAPRPVFFRSAFACGC